MCGWKNFFFASSWNVPLHSFSYMMFGVVPAATSIVRAGSVISRVLPGRQILRFPLEDHGLQRAALVGNRFDRIDVLGEGDAFLERLDHFFVIQAVGRRIHHPLAIGDR